MEVQNCRVNIVDSKESYYEYSWISGKKFTQGYEEFDFLIDYTIPQALWYSSFLIYFDLEANISIEKTDNTL